MVLPKTPKHRMIFDTKTSQYCRRINTVVNNSHYMFFDFYVTCTKFETIVNEGV